MVEAGIGIDEDIGGRRSQHVVGEANTWIRAQACGAINRVGVIGPTVPGNHPFEWHHTQAHGLLNKQIAAELGISAKTSEKHRYSLMEKLNIHDTAGLTQYAIAAGLTEGPV